jgi:hypothetical protein
LSDHLTSWTRTLNEDDALLLIEEAEPGLSLEDWTERGHDELPQSSRDRRTELIRLVRDRLLDWDADAIADTRWLALMGRLSPGARRQLLHARYLFEHPWILRAQAELIAPRIEASEVPLAPRDADRISHDDWVAFVEQTVRPGTGPESVKKTRSVLMRNLARLGVIARKGERGEHARVKRSTPDGRVFGWLIGHELRTRNLGEGGLTWALTQSRAAILLRPSGPYAERCVEEAISAGLLRQSYIAGESRLLDGGI